MRGHETLETMRSDAELAREKRTRHHPKGKWVRTSSGPYAGWVFRAPDGSVHARIERQPEAWGGTRPYLVYTMHTEGNDRFTTWQAAAARGIKRLTQLLEETEALR